MDNLTLCSKILFDVDVIKKTNKIKELENILNTPVILYTNKEDWKLAKIKMFNEIKNYLEFEWIHFINKYNFNLLLVEQVYQIGFILFKSLNSLTNNKHIKWCKNTSHNIITGIEVSIFMLLKLNKLRCFNPTELILFIYNSIIYLLDEDQQDPSILSDIPIYENEI